RRNRFDPRLDAGRPALRGVDRDRRVPEYALQLRGMLELLQAGGRVGLSLERPDYDEVDMVATEEALGLRQIRRLVDRADGPRASVELHARAPLLQEVIVPAEHRRQAGVHRHAGERLIRGALRFEQHGDPADLSIEPA